MLMLPLVVATVAVAVAAGWRWLGFRARRSPKRLTLASKWRPMAYADVPAWVVIRPQMPQFGTR